MNKRTPVELQLSYRREFGGSRSLCRIQFVSGSFGVQLETNSNSIEMSAASEINWSGNQRPNLGFRLRGEILPESQGQRKNPVKGKDSR